MDDVGFKRRLNSAAVCCKSWKVISDIVVVEGVICNGDRSAAIISWLVVWLFGTGYYSAAKAIDANIIIGTTRILYVNLFTNINY